MQTLDEKAMQHFLSLALRGDDPAAGSGERQAARLARAIADEAPGLDGLAQDGARDFILYAAAHPEHAKELLATRKT